VKLLVIGLINSGVFFAWSCVWDILSWQVQDGVRDSRCVVEDSTNEATWMSRIGSAGSDLVPATPRDRYIWEDVVEAPPKVEVHRRSEVSYR
jgi:hypothetical protein